MSTSAIASVQTLLHQAASLLVYQSVFADGVGEAFLALLQSIRHAERNRAAEDTECLQAYGRWFRALAEHDQSWQDYLLAQILCADNPFTQKVQRFDFGDLPSALVAAARHDLQILQQFYAISNQQLSQWVKAAAHLTIAPVVWSRHENAALDGLRSTLHESTDWGDRVESLAG